MERSIDRYARHSEGYTRIPDAARVFGARVANTISASGLASRQQAGHLTAIDRVGLLLNP